MYLHKMYGHSVTTAFHALLMYVSMVIAQSFLARTFGSYTLQLFDVENTAFWVPVLGACLLIAVFLINLTSNKYIQGTVGIAPALTNAIYAASGKRIRELPVSKHLDVY